MRSDGAHALTTRDISYEALQEVILQFSAYYGFAKGEVMNDVAAEEWERIVHDGASGT